MHTGSLGSHGYPQATSLRNRSEPAHRVHWLLVKGPIPQGQMVLHRCNNKHCVNLEHLYLGTHVENMDDVAKVGHPKRKLSSEQVAEARAPGSGKAVARRLGVSEKAIWNIRQGVTYRHVAGA